MEKEVIRLLVNNPVDRGNIVKGLVNAGYTVWVEAESNEDIDFPGTNHFICCSVRRMFE